MADKVIITGKNGGLSKAVNNRLGGEYEATLLGVKNKGWESESFCGVKAIVHVAGLVPKAGVKNEDFYYVNTLLTADLARKAKNDGVKLFVYISSMAVYGRKPILSVEKGRVKKEDEPMPTDDYGKSKLLAENYLYDLADENFKVAVIRAPSIYGANGNAYFEQFFNILRNFKSIPVAFTKNYKSAINTDNLSELIYLIVKNNQSGIFCPDDGLYSAADYCAAINPERKKSAFYGFIIEKLLRLSKRVKDYFGAIYYDESLSVAFGGAYRVKSMEQAVKEIYGK